MLWGSTYLAKKDELKSETGDWGALKLDFQQVSKSQIETKTSM